MKIVLVLCVGACFGLIWSKLFGWVFFLAAQQKNQFFQLDKHPFNFKHILTVLSCLFLTRTIWALSAVQLPAKLRAKNLEIERKFFWEKFPRFRLVSWFSRGKISFRTFKLRTIKLAYRSNGNVVKNKKKRKMLSGNFHCVGEIF